MDIIIKYFLSLKTIPQLEWVPTGVWKVRFNKEQMFFMKWSETSCILWLSTSRKVQQMNSKYGKDLFNFQKTDLGSAKLFSLLYLEMETQL